ncbi:MAG TPA: peptidoglycan DD-metalloendopeptidase family protein [Actinomycetota bacterium]|nr:peptidoglycan DD-metalloendopeptidase family protein [Actinomycetota bacterium]
MPALPPPSARRRRLVATSIAAALVLAVPIGAVAEDALKEARQELRETKERIRARVQKMREIQKDMNRIATRIAETEEQIHQAEQRQKKLTREIAELEAERDRLQALLDERTREAYILGPGMEMLYLLTATSAEDAVNRIGFLDEMNRRDAILAKKVADTEARLMSSRWELERIQSMLEASRSQLARDHAELRKKMAESRRLYALLRQRKEVVLANISRIRPFAVCPVQGPHAISNSFGIWVHRSKARGGDHVHQGNDISAAMGTPIVAPFDGNAVTSPNKMGGLAVKVYGKYGYVYNAHLSRYGKLGPVHRGDVIGYVGATGNAGGPHDHFEWHPGNGPAVDPYHFLTLVC